MNHESCFLAFLSHFSIPFSEVGCFGQKSDKKNEFLKRNNLDDLQTFNDVKYFVAHTLVGKVCDFSKDLDDKKHFLEPTVGSVVHIK